MIENLTHILEVSILPLGPWGVFLASVAEEVVAPVPSALVMMTAGFIFISGPVSFASILKLVLFVGLPAALGVTLGSLWIYGVAYWGGRASVDRFGKWIGLYWSDVEKMQEHFSKNNKDELGIIGARVLPIVPSVAISAFCGFIRMKFWKYFTLTFVGMFFRAIIMGSIGWQVGNVYHRYAEVFARFEKILLYMVVFGAVVFLVIFESKRRKRQHIMSNIDEQVNG